ncbi:hypothetical protein EMIHUDRAFT_256247 [Emiliania huxleyi CCMP1516]|uniref:Uncharacterized protein n=2 Tax=Emiliania huxleyi TaxID=2903 RepID=A0A0D3IY26_EMIH1|nr:hypothetical protein EMIHUDRAFT_256247 [Emiliania huxleyi CCMP1516]EOD16161.1 hypothetical protein EMIHUDRAFT_256247 [Emiliania huxleyi CCMP1516]|eukprot:XP_005768590.1 hypothetical protein EMIHUDRAFT_256247 [Emiliania huxleyi CCMP1516]
MANTASARSAKALPSTFGGVSDFKQLRRLLYTADQRRFHRTIFFAAAASGDLQILHERLRAGSPRVDTRGNYGRTALWLACERGHIDCVRALLAAGASVELGESGMDNNRPLHVAILNGHALIAFLLLEAMQELLTAAGGGRIALGFPLLQGDSEQTLLMTAPPNTRPRLLGAFSELSLGAFLQAPPNARPGERLLMYAS